MEMVGLGNLSPNLVMLGFKEKWRQSPQETRDYVSVILHALELRLSVALLRVQVSNNSRPWRWKMPVQLETRYSCSAEDLVTCEKIIFLDISWISDLHSKILGGNFDFQISPSVKFRTIGVALHGVNVRTSHSAATGSNLIAWEIHLLDFLAQRSREPSSGV